MEMVSVIIPTYNRCEKLRKSIESVLSQTYDNLELLIVDDGSTDNTQDMVEMINDSRIRYIKLPQNGGASYARNEGVRLATSEIIAFQDSDDLWRPNKLEKQMNYLEKHPEFSMVYCQYLYHKGDRMGVVPNENQIGLEGDVYPYILKRNTIGTPTMLFRKSCFLDVGGFDTERKCLEDWEFALRFAEVYLIGFVNEVLMDAYYTEGSVSSLGIAGIDTRCYIIARNAKYMVQYGVFDEAVGNLFQMASEIGILNEVRSLLETYMKKYC